MSRTETIGLTDGGGRGSALVHAYGKSPHVGRILAVPGNALMGMNVREGVTFERLPGKLAAANAHGIADLLTERATFVDVCQDDVVMGGAVNRLRERRIPVLGPTREAGRIEWDKAWARRFMKRHSIPHPAFLVCDSEKKGIAYVRSQRDRRWAVKASGPTLGKGVSIAANNDEAIAAIGRMKTFGESGGIYLLEEYLEGEEFSSYAVCDGQHYRMIGHAQDHKRIFDGDEGPNTGGMGCSSSPLVMTQDILQQVDDILRRTFEGLSDEGAPYVGVLYLGGIVVHGKVFVIEFNARWGDPEAQVIMPGLTTDLFEIGQAAIEGRIRDIQVRFDDRIRVAVALAAKGYPADYSAVRGKEITGIEEAARMEGVTIYGAGVEEENGRFFANGGRLLYVVGEGANVIEAREKAYGAMDRIEIEGGNGHYRTDIGSRDVRRLQGI